MISTVSIAMSHMEPYFSVVSSPAFMNKLVGTEPYAALYLGTYPPSIFAGQICKKNYQTRATIDQKRFENALAIQAKTAILGELNRVKKKFAPHHEAALKNPLLFQPETSENFLSRHLAHRSLKQLIVQKEELNRTIMALELELKTLNEVKENSQFDVNMLKATYKIFLSSVAIGISWGISKYTAMAVWDIVNKG